MSTIDLPDFAADLRAGLKARAASEVAIPVIQPAEPFLDTAGEDLRRRIFLTESETGATLCLRPEFTIPVCLHHIEAAAGTPNRYAYLGTVFRQRREGDSEFYQAGIEDLGNTDHGEADARAIDDACLLLSDLLPGRSTETIVGDQAVFEAVVAALGLPGGWQKRLIHAFGNETQLAAMLDRLANPRADAGFDNAVATLMAAGGEDEIVAHIEQAMAETGYSASAGRSPREIARRLKEKADLARTKLEPGALSTLREFLALDVALADAPAALTGFAASAGLKMDDALAEFSARIERLSGLRSLESMRYRAAFGRPLDYYTGLVFEVTDATTGAVLCGGGRYDRLLTLLGADKPIPAVGFALWLDRIGEARADAPQLPHNGEDA